MTAAMVVSLPVPAVVGTAISISGSRRTFRVPASRSAGLPSVTEAATALAASNTEPPPTATMASQPSAQAFASSTMPKVGSGETRSNTAVWIPAARISASIPSSWPRRIIPGVVITSAFSLAAVRSSAAVSRRRPAPI